MTTTKQAPIIDLATATYRANACAAFLRSREKYGRLSNMTPGFPLEVNGIRFQGPEGLYQALKFLDPKVQKRIGAQRSGMDAKRVAYSTQPFRKDWNSIRVPVMAYTIGQKLLQHPRAFGDALLETGDLPIVEKSYRDQFWGAEPTGNALVGANALGKILTLYRDSLKENPDNVALAVARAANLPLKPLVVNGQPVPPLG